MYARSTLLGAYYSTVMLLGGAGILLDMSLFSLKYYQPSSVYNVFAISSLDRQLIYLTYWHPWCVTHVPMPQKFSCHNTMHFHGLSPVFYDNTTDYANSLLGVLLIFSLIQNFHDRITDCGTYFPSSKQSPTPGNSSSSNFFRPHWWMSH